MAATAAFPSLSVPQDDSMDMSSPANQAHDTDIDLDFGDGEYDGGVTLQEDEHMLTDGEQTRPQTATDEMMDDDAQLDQTEVQEEVMQDTPDIEPLQVMQQDDEELIDYGDEEYYNQEDTTLVNAIEIHDQTFQQGDENVEQIDEEIVRQPEDVGLVEQPQVLEEVEAAPAEFVPAIDSISVEAAAISASEAPLAPAEGATLEEQQIQHPGVAQAADNSTYVEPGAEHVEHVGSGEGEDTGPVVHDGTADDFLDQPALTVDTSVLPEAEEKTPATPTDTGLHPMKIYYGDLCCPLFKSKHQPDGLLKDDNLASLSLHELMNNCRQRLALRTGNVPEDQEFTLVFDHMGLMLVENSRAAFEHSLNDVLEVYLQLHLNDGTDECPPLSLTLTQQQFSTQLAVLKQAADVGKGMSDFVPVEHSEEEQAHDEDAQEEYEANGETTEGHEEQPEQYDEAADNTTAANGQHFEDAFAQEEDEYQHGDEEAQYGQEYTEEPHEVSEQPDGAADVPQHVLTEEGDEATTTEQHAEAEIETANAEAEGSADDEQQAARAEEQNASPEEPHEEHEKPASSASSQTLHGDDAEVSNDQADVDGKDGAQNREDFSTFLNDVDGEGAEAGDQHVNEVAAAEQAAAADHELQYLGSEDFLGEHEEQHVGQGLDEEQNGDDAAEDEDHYDEADADNEQYEAGFQPGDEEQYHTAHDFPEGGDYEHGLEHVANGEDYTGETEAAEADPEGDAYEDPGQVDLGDDIGFDDEIAEDDHGAHPSTAPKVNGTGSPLGKRSFDEAAEDHWRLDEPDAKKAKAE